MDITSCWDKLNNADSDNDSHVTAGEYVTFAQDFVAPSIIDNVDSYSDLPHEFIAAFTSSACLCNNALVGGDPNRVYCCLGANAHIRVPRLPLDSANLTEGVYLYLTCLFASKAARGASRSSTTAI